MNLKPIIPYAIPVLTAILGAAGGYTGHSAVSSPVEAPRQEYKFCPAIDFSKIDLSKLKIPAAKLGTARNMNTVAKLAEMAAQL